MPRRRRHPSLLAGPASVLATLAAVAALLGGPPRPPPALATLLHLGPGRPERSPWKTLEGLDPVLQEVEAGRDRRTAVVFRGPGRWSAPIGVPESASLRFAVYSPPGGAPARLSLRLRAGGSAHRLHDERVASGRRWHERRADLPGPAGPAADLEVAVDGPGPVALAHPEVVGPGDATDGSAFNVILYVVDCLRADHVGAYGYPRPTTPHLDRLARGGVVFEDVVACASWTKPAVGCLLTSSYPISHGARTVDDVLDPDRTTLSEAFRGAGYATAAWVANPFVSTPAFGLTRGFDRVVQTVDKPPSVNINDLPADAADITRRVVPWLEANADRRFFAYLHSIDLHAGYRRRPPFDRLFLSRDRRGEERQVDLYDNELAYNDREIGRLFEALTRLGLEGRTIVAVTADHGEEFGEHGFTRHGHTLYQTLLHVPWILRLPGGGRAGTRVGSLASHVDVAPTLLDFAGVRRPGDFEGLSLRPAVEQRSTPPRAAVYAEQLSPKEALYAARSRRYKAVTQLLPAPSEALYDLATDPGETRNLLPHVPEGARPLLEDLRRLVQQGQEGYHVSIAAEPGTPVRLEAATEAVLADVQRFALVTGETLDVSPGGRRVVYVFDAAAHPRYLVLRTAPPGAPVRLDVSFRGRRLPPEGFELGPERRHPAATPVTVTGDSVLAARAEAAGLRAVEAEAVRVWYQPPPPARKAVLDPDLQEKLRALGYVQ